MRKLVYPLVAVLFFYASSNCYAQDVENAKAAYKVVNQEFNPLESGLKEVINKAEHAYKNHLKYDSSRFDVLKDSRIPAFNESFSHLQKEYAADATHKNKDISKWYNEASTKKKSIDSLYDKAKTAVKNAKQGQ